jgi:hypothetical protein
VFARLSTLVPTAAAAPAATVVSATAIPTATARIAAVGTARVVAGTASQNTENTQDEHTTVITEHRKIPPIGF